MVEDDIAAGRLWRLPPYDTPPPIDVYLVHDPAARRTRAESILLERLKLAIAERPLAARTYPPEL